MYKVTRGNAHSSGFQKGERLHAELRIQGEVWSRPGHWRELIYTELLSCVVTCAPSSGSYVKTSLPGLSRPGETSVLESRQERASKALRACTGLANRKESGNREVVHR